MATILLVEDEMIVSLVETKTLEGFGYRVITANTGEAAVEAALDDESRVDIVLMDIDLGEGIDGTEAARLILAKRTLPIVFLTSHSERECVEKVRGITRYGYVVKNSGNFVLQSSIEMAFELFAAHERMRTDEARLTTLLKTIPDLVWLKDENGVFLSCNAAFSRYYGATEAAIIGKTDYDFVDKTLADAFRENDHLAIEHGGQRSNEEWIVYPDDGQRALLETIKTPMLDESGKLVGVLGIGRDITERKRIEVALKKSEESVRRKLDAIVEPEGDLGELGLSDIVDVGTLQSLMEDFSALTGMVIALLDTEGAVLIATGWQDICTKFHRVYPESSASCTESDLFLSANVKPGEYVEYRCKNNMWDIVTPLYIESRHVGNIYSGQFFYSDDVMDEKVFLAQARRYGFDEEEYLSALRRVPRFSHEDINRLMDLSRAPDGLRLAAQLQQSPAGADDDRQAARGGSPLEVRRREGDAAEGAPAPRQEQPQHRIELPPSQYGRSPRRGLPAHLPGSRGSHRLRRDDLREAKRVDELELGRPRQIPRRSRRPSSGLPTRTTPSGSPSRWTWRPWIATSSERYPSGSYSTSSSPTR